LAWTAAPAWYTARWSQRPTCTTSTRCLICCTATSSVVYGDSAYASQKALIQTKAPQARDFTNQRVRRGGGIDEVPRAKNRNKSKVRARVEHVFAVVKRLWGFSKVRYRGLAKNATRSFAYFGERDRSFRPS
jgi:hypothetical protein